MPVPTSTTLGALDAREQREAALDEDLGLRARHQGARVAAQLEAVEAPAPEHVGERLAAAPATHELAQEVDLGGLERAVVVEVQLEPLDPEHVGEQVLGV